MIVDPSATVATLPKEPESGGFYELSGRRDDQLPVPGYLELSIMPTARGVTDLAATLDMILLGLGVEVVPFTLLQACLAQEAHLRLGRGSGYPVRLNLGGCTSYALVKDAEKPPLFKGNDFVHIGPNPASRISS